MANIYCIGRNYVNHAKELGNEVPKQPLLFSKPTHALARADGSTYTYDYNKEDIHYELEIVLHIGKAVRPGDKVDDVVDKIGLGVDLTLRNLQSKLKEKGHPWLRAKGFPNSAILTNLWEFKGVEDCRNRLFSLYQNGNQVQCGSIRDMLFDFQAIIDECSTCFGLGKGDLIYTGTPEGVGSVEHGDHFVLKWDEEVVGSFQTQRSQSYQ
ncbi:fumarylacetoacetate hydrolase family protein [Alkalihalobacillus pseudalcaliphilus]|uniref:fumarylacetoacetate hydrolase family protein n=1 Tax=Alkalihalobacillus pseudalcaliphilus TaxID=79884 RepID=UPI00064D73B1|nr:fumarylacetoacetate hydrolase family protein [Alkalihalobacillus pseudalcaliphilus]KMK75646.1 fumarylacetoacetate hydrolase [Alkalihalobacillus pseudalcaliphilus]